MKIEFKCTRESKGEKYIDGEGHKTKYKYKFVSKDEDTADKITATFEQPIPVAFGDVVVFDFTSKQTRLEQRT